MEDIFNTVSSSTINKWSWEKSNGSASEEQTTLAYQALENNGKCHDFSYLIWNDIVSLVDQCLDGLYLTWDCVITSRDEAKLSSTDKLLTAKKFNSVRKQLDRFNKTWYWEENKDDIGYVGRKDFLGRSDVGRANADKLYGKYLIEITNALNVMIEKLDAILQIHGVIDLNLNVRILLSCTVTQLLTIILQFGVHVEFASLNTADSLLLNILHSEMVACANLEYDNISELISFLNLNLGGASNNAILFIKQSIPLFQKENLNMDFVNNLETINIRLYDYQDNLMSYALNIDKDLSVNSSYIKDIGLKTVPNVTDHLAAYLIYSIVLSKIKAMLGVSYSSANSAVLNNIINSNINIVPINSIGTNISSSIDIEQVSICISTNTKSIERLIKYSLNIVVELDDCSAQSITGSALMTIAQISEVGMGVPYPLFSLCGFTLSCANDLQVTLGFPVLNHFNETLNTQANLNYMDGIIHDSYLSITSAYFTDLSLWFAPIEDEKQISIRQSFDVKQIENRLFIN